MGQSGLSMKTLQRQQELKEIHQLQQLLYAYMANGHLDTQY